MGMAIKITNKEERERNALYTNGKSFLHLNFFFFQLRAFYGVESIHIA